MSKELRWEDLPGGTDMNIKVGSPEFKELVLGVMKRKHDDINEPDFDLTPSREEIIHTLNTLKSKLDAQLAVLNQAIANTKDDGEVVELVHARDKIHDNKIIADCEIDIHKLHIRIQNILDKYEVV